MRAPTLAGIKTGSLFSVDCPDKKLLNQQIRAYNQLLFPKGMVMLPLRFRSGRALIILAITRLLSIPPRQIPPIDSLD